MLAYPNHQLPRLAHGQFLSLRGGPLKAVYMTALSLLFCCFSMGLHASSVLPPVSGPDTIPPVITCPATVYASNDSGICGNVVTWPAPTATDDCGIQSITGSANSGDFFPVDSTLIFFIAVDSGGNSDTCSFAVVVQDTSPPQLICPGNILVGNSGDSCGVSVSWFEPTITDNCGIDTIITQQTNGAFFPVGDHVVFYLPTDVNGNSNACDFAIIVFDSTAPSVTCPPTQFATTDSGQCGAVVNWPAIQAFDNCTIDTIITSMPNGSFFPVDSSIVSVVAYDEYANADSCEFVVSILDTEDPVLICPADVAVNNDPGQCGANVTWNAPFLSDNCNATILSSSSQSGDFFAVGGDSVFVTAADDAGNTVNCAFAVSVTDAEPPVLVCPGDTTFIADSATCATNVSWNLPLISDNCVLDTTFSNMALGSTLGAGVHPIVYTALDSSGLVDSCDFNVTVAAAALSATVSAPLSACGFNLDCNGGTNGEAVVAISGGCEPYSVLWSNGNTNATADSLTAGTYTVTVTDSLGATAMDTIVLTSPPAMTVFLALDSLVCVGDSDGSIDLSTTGGNPCGGLTYLWSNGATTEDVSQLAPGLYTVTVTDTLGCTAVGSKEITPQPLPPVDLGPDTVLCAGTSLDLDAGAGLASYQWSNGSVMQVVVVSAPGTFGVTVTDQIGCQNSDDISITYFPAVDSIISPREGLLICQGDSVLLEGEVGLTNYLWSTGATTQNTFVSGVGGFVYLDAEDGNGCPVRDSVEVEFNNVPKPNPLVTPGDLVLCDGEMVTLGLSAAYDEYLWSTGSVFGTIDVDMAGQYWALVTDTLGCEGSSDTVSISYVPNPLPTIFLQNDTLFVNGTYPAYAWIRNGSFIGNATQSYYVPLVSASYAVQVTDTNGCEGVSDTLFVDVSIDVEDALATIPGLDIFPNPARTFLTLRSAESLHDELSVCIFDLQGRELRNYLLSHLEQQAQLELGELPGGMYILRIRDAKGRSALMRFVVANGG